MVLNLYCYSRPHCGLELGGINPTNSQRSFLEKRIFFGESVQALLYNDCLKSGFGFMNTFPNSSVGLKYLTLTESKPNAANVIPSLAFDGWMTWVRVDSLTRGNNTTQFNVFFGKLDQLFFDPAR